MVHRIDAHNYSESSFRASLMRTRCLQRPNRGEEPSVFFELEEHKVPQVCFRAGEYARSLTDFGMTVSEIGLFERGATTA